MTQFGHASSLIRAFIIGGVFLCMQIAAVEHAAAHGDDNHSHDGVPCLIQILSDGPAAPNTKAAICRVEQLITGILGTAYSCPAGLRLNYSYAIRAPPSLSH
jgi:hypothetical protein